MDLDELIVGVYCLIDETLAGITNGRRLRQRGPDPLLSDASGADDGDRRGVPRP